MYEWISSFLSTIERKWKFWKQVSQRILKSFLRSILLHATKNKVTLRFRLRASYRNQSLNMWVNIVYICNKNRNFFFLNSNINPTPNNLQRTYPLFFLSIPGIRACVELNVSPLVVGIGRVKSSTGCSFWGSIVSGILNKNLERCYKCERMATKWLKCNCKRSLT